MTLPSEAWWTDCDGFATRFDWPGYPDHYPRPPPEWNDDVRAVSGVLLEFVDCTRFSLGDFERPVQMLLEWTDLGEWPASCHRENTTYIPYILSGVWTNDTEVAAYMGTVLGITTYVASFEHENVTTETGPEFVWSMTQDGKESVLHTSISDDRTTSQNILNRIYWFPEEGGVGYIDWDIISIETDRISRYTYGNVEPPLLMAQWPTDYAGYGSRYTDGTYGGEVQMFEDVLCEEPR